MANNNDYPTLDFTVKEINRILGDGVINLSTMESQESGCPCCRDEYNLGSLRLLTLEEALPLVQEKERGTGKIITFLNKDVDSHKEPDPHLEMWIYTGQTITSWFDVTKWKKVPLATVSSAAYNEYVLSSSAKRIEVVEQAPSVKDDVLYFEYEPMPDHSVYKYRLMLPDGEIHVGVPLHVRYDLYTHLVGAAGQDRVRTLFGVLKPKNHVEVTAEDFDGTSYSFQDKGYCGPSYGYNLPVDYEATAEATLNFSAQGDYTIFCKLVQVDSGTVLSTLEKKIKVLA